MFCFQNVYVVVLTGVLHNATDCAIYSWESRLQKKKINTSLIVFLYIQQTFCSHNKHTKLVSHSWLYSYINFMIHFKLYCVNRWRALVFLYINVHVVVKSFLEWKLPSVFNSLGNALARLLKASFCILHIVMKINCN